MLGVFLSGFALGLFAFAVVLAVAVNVRQSRP
jgi:hypothetical protein